MRNRSALLAVLRHRNIDGKVEGIPDDCENCHTEDEGLDSMSKIAHSKRYASLSSSQFVTRHQGS